MSQPSETNNNNSSQTGEKEEQQTELSSSSSNTDNNNNTNNANSNPNQSQVNILEFLTSQLKENIRDRLFMLNVERDLISFLRNEKHDYHKFQPMNPYYRMLVHRIGEYFGLGHNLDHLKQSVIVFKTEKSKMPLVSFMSIINSSNGVDKTTMNGNSSESSSSNSMTPNSSSPNLVQLVNNNLQSDQVATQPPPQPPSEPQIPQKKQILKREVNDQDPDSAKNKLLNKKQNEIKPKTFEEKTAEYMRVKNRIFNSNPIQTATDTSDQHTNQSNTKQYTILNRQASQQSTKANKPTASTNINSYKPKSNSPIQQQQQTTNLVQNQYIQQQIPQAFKLPMQAPVYPQQQQQQPPLIPAQFQNKQQPYLILHHSASYPNTNLSNSMIAVSSAPNLAPPPPQQFNINPQFFNPYPIHQGLMLANLMQPTQPQQFIPPQQAHMQTTFRPNPDRYNTNKKQTKTYQPQVARSISINQNLTNTKPSNQYAPKQQRFQKPNQKYNQQQQQQQKQVKTESQKIQVQVYNLKENLTKSMLNNMLAPYVKSIDFRQKQEQDSNEQDVIINEKNVDVIIEFESLDKLEQAFKLFNLNSVQGVEQQTADTAGKLSQPFLLRPISTC